MIDTTNSMTCLKYEDDRGNVVLALSKQGLMSMADGISTIRYELPDGHWLIVANQDVALQWIAEQEQVESQGDAAP